MRALGWHAALCLIDLAMIFASIFICSPFGKMVVYGYQAVFCFWIPFWIIKRSFRQLDGMGEYLFRMACLDQEPVL